jgi:hypothetical protein
MGGNKIDAKKQRQYRTLLRSTELQRGLLVKAVNSNVPVLELLRYKHSTEVALSQLTALSAWRSLTYYRQGGVFKDVLQVGVICQYVIVIELHKRRLFIYIPWTKSGLLTLFTATRTGLFTI